MRTILRTGAMLIASAPALRAPPPNPHPTLRECFEECVASNPTGKAVASFAEGIGIMCFVPPPET